MNENHANQLSQLHMLIDTNKVQLKASLEMLLVLISVKFYGNCIVPIGLIKTLSTIPDSAKVREIISELVILKDGDIETMKATLRGVERSER